MSFGFDWHSFSDLDCDEKAEEQSNRLKPVVHFEMSGELSPQTIETVVVVDNLPFVRVRDLSRSGLILSFHVPTLSNRKSVCPPIDLCHVYRHSSRLLLVHASSRLSKAGFSFHFCLKLMPFLRPEVRLFVLCCTKSMKLLKYEKLRHRGYYTSTGQDLPLPPLPEKLCLSNLPAQVLTFCKISGCQAVALVANLPQAATPNENFDQIRSTFASHLPAELFEHCLMPATNTETRVRDHRRSVEETLVT